MKIEKVDYCTDCGELAVNCKCEEFENDCCPKCEMIMEIVDEILMTDSVEESFEILKDFIEIVEKCAFDAGYVAALRNEAEVLMDIADDLEK